jgi:hypothetical protein
MFTYLEQSPTMDELFRMLGMFMFHVQTRKMDNRA